MKDVCTNLCLSTVANISKSGLNETYGRCELAWGSCVVGQERNYLYLTLVGNSLDKLRSLQKRMRSCGTDPRLCERTYRSLKGTSNVVGRRS